MDINDKIIELEDEILRKKMELNELRKKVKPKPISNYTFRSNLDLSLDLTDLFGEKNELIIVHNMGNSCQFCTMWADGFNGIYKHLEKYAGFVLESSDTVNEQTKISEERGWTFKMISSLDTTLKYDLGFTKKDGTPIPGISIIEKQADGTLFQKAKAQFGPGDDFCIVWHVLDLLPSDVIRWSPKFNLNGRKE
jgi:predicted dithiol-disulfide oxidoreductase (DUF899 family)